MPRGTKELSRLNIRFESFRFAKEKGASLNRFVEIIGSNSSRNRHTKVRPVLNPNEWRMEVFESGPMTIRRNYPG
ncbi:unnamed protein product [Victoria cruziana]